MTEGPYDLPAGWRWVRLGEVCRYDRRTVDPRQSPQRTFYLYSIPAYDKGQRPEKLDGSQIGSSKVVVGPGVCLFSKLNPRIPRAWVVAEVPQDGVPVASTEFMPLRPNPDVLDLNYLGNLLVAEAFLSQVQQGVTGATGSRQRLKPEAILNTVIPLPPLEEQRRIVARIEELMARVREARRLREQAGEDAERLWQAVLAETFPRPGSYLPAGWRWVRLGELFVLKNGKFIRKSELQESGSIRVYGSNGLLGYVDGREPIVSDDTIVIGRVGACGAVNWAVAPAWISDNAMYVAEWLEPCDRRYILLALHQANLASRAQKGAQPSISQDVVYTTFIPLPPLGEQRRIVAHLEAVQEKIRALKASQAETKENLKRLEQSILDKAFRGEL